jgi:hypothetical protein
MYRSHGVLQVWLALNNLLVEPESHAKLGQHFEGARAERLLGVRERMTDILLDQVPILRDLRRVLDELAMGCARPLEGAVPTSLIIEQVRLPANNVSRRFTCVKHEAVLTFSM